MSKITKCVFCNGNLTSDGGHYVCFNDDCVSANTGHPKKMYEKFEKLSILLKRMELTAKENNDYFVRLIMSALFETLEEIAFWKD